MKSFHQQLPALLTPPQHPPPPFPTSTAALHLQLISQRSAIEEREAAIHMLEAALRSQMVYASTLQSRATINAAAVDVQQEEAVSARLATELLHARNRIHTLQARLVVERAKRGDDALPPQPPPVPKRVRRTVRVTPGEFEELLHLRGLRAHLNGALLSQSEEIARLRSALEYARVAAQPQLTPDGEPLWEHYRRKYHAELVCDETTGEVLVDALGNATPRWMPLKARLEESERQVEAYRFRFGELAALAPVSSEADAWGV
jgi:hypothetical protein